MYLSFFKKRKTKLTASPPPLKSIPHRLSAHHAFSRNPPSIHHMVVARVVMKIEGHEEQLTVSSGCFLSQQEACPVPTQTLDIMLLLCTLSQPHIKWDPKLCPFYLPRAHLIPFIFATGASFITIICQLSPYVFPIYMCVLNRLSLLHLAHCIESLIYMSLSSTNVIGRIMAPYQGCPRLNIQKL